MEKMMFLNISVIMMVLLIIVYSFQITDSLGILC